MDTQRYDVRYPPGPDGEVVGFVELDPQAKGVAVHAEVCGDTLDDFVVKGLFYGARVRYARRQVINAAKYRAEELLGTTVDPDLAV